MPTNIRLMTAEDLDAAMELKDAEGWNQTRDDWDLFLRMAPASCLVAVEDDKVVGTVAGINYTNRVAWIGMMLVNRSYRGQGISKMLMKAVIQSLNRVASIKLDATPAGFPVYRQLGFEEEYTLLRMVATSPEVPDDWKVGVSKERVKKLDVSHMSDIHDLDREVFGADRTEVLLHNLRSLPPLALGIGDATGKISGYLMARKGTRYVHLGPLVANHDATAKLLLVHSMEKCSDVSCVIDVPKKKQDWIYWLESCGFHVQRELFRMYLKENGHPGDTSRLYAICGPELG